MTNNQNKKVDTVDKLSNSELINLYSIYFSGQRDVCSEIYKLMNIFFTGNFLILGGSIAVFTTVTPLYFRDICVLLCGILICTLIAAYIKMSERAYKSQLTLIAQCAKIEDLLDFNNLDYYAGKSYLTKSSLIPERHLDGRTPDKENEKNSITDFVDKHYKKGQRKYVKGTAIAFLLYGILLIIYSTFDLFLQYII